MTKNSVILITINNINQFLFPTLLAILNEDFRGNPGDYTREGASIGVRI